MKRVPRDSSPSRFSPSEKREHVFEKFSNSGSQTFGEENGWVDFYQLLDVPPDTSTHDLDEAIISRGADVVYATISRGAKPPHVEVMEKYLHDMRPILLDPTVRRRYDEQLQKHKIHAPDAMSYDAFKSTLDLREQSGSCLSTLLFLLGAPLVWWSLEKIISSRFI